MATKAEKKKIIRQDIIAAADIYGSYLAGKSFLYVYGMEYFEVLFPISHFLHLTGVGTKLSAKDFYKNARKSKLSINQFYFDDRHLYANAKKKLPCLKRLPELTDDMVCVLKDMKTMTIVYKLSVTNLEFTLGLVKDANIAKGRLQEYYLPMSLRVNDSSVERCNTGEVIDFIFSKDASLDRYNVVLVQDKGKELPPNVRFLIDDSLYE